VSIAPNGMNVTMKNMDAETGRAGSDARSLFKE